MRLGAKARAYLFDSSFRDTAQRILIAFHVPQFGFAPVDDSRRFESLSKLVIH